MIDFKLPIKLSLYIGLPSLAIIIYYLQKNKKETEEYDYENTIRSRQTIIEVKVPSDCVRAIIGPGGSVIKEIQNKTGTRINFKDKNLDIKPNEQTTNPIERILLIRGANTNAQHAELEIKRLILDVSVMLTEEFYVPDYACGRIIGKGGTSIREISQMSGCRVKLSDKIFNLDNKSIYNITDEINDNSFKRKLISISGNAEQIAFAKKLIISKIREEELLREKRMSKQNKMFSKLVREKASSNSISTQSSSELSSNKISAPNSTPVMPSLIDWKSYLDKDNSSDVFITAICNPNAFWIQLVNQDSLKLENLLNDMNNHYNNNKTEPFNDLNELKIGSLVSAKYDEKNWHRAEIIDFKTIDNIEKVDIYFIDYGDSAYVDFHKLRKLETKFYDLPIHAIECNLNDISPIIDTCWSEESIDYFEEITYSCKWKVVRLKVLDSSQKKLSVTLFDSRKNISISDLMIQKGFAKSKIEITTNEI